MKTPTIAFCAALTLACMPTARAQTLLHRYSFSANPNDSVGTANGTVVGNVTFQVDYNNPANGNAVFNGGTSGSAPGYIKLPASAVSGLQNATIEMFTTGFYAPGQPAFEALFSVAAPYPDTSTYLVLSGNRAGGGLGTGARAGNGAETVITGPNFMLDGNHVVHMVFSGFNGAGTTGTETIYFDGAPVAQGNAANSLAALTMAAGGNATLGIGGGSPFNDHTFVGGMNEVRIWNGALSPDQIAADVDAGPSALGFAAALPFTAADAVRALQIAAGMGAAATANETARYNVEMGDASTAVIDVSDALRIARKAALLD